MTLKKLDCLNIFSTVDSALVGMSIIFRDSIQNIDLIHIAVDQKYSSTGIYADQLLVLKMINELKKICLQIKGINTITVKYGNDWIINLTRT